MEFLSRFSPLRAYRDLRRFMATRKRHELWLLIPSFLITMFVVFSLQHDFFTKPAYKREILYVKSWPLTRSEAEIHAQQIIDRAERMKAEAELEKQRKERQRQFKKVDDKLKSWGI
jgi:hypothetical protein